MDWEDLKTFVAVAKSGTVRGGADRLGVHHATVGRRIARLEKVTGTRLFDRRPEGLSLTPTGEELLTVSARVAEELEAAGRRIAGEDSVAKGRVTASMGEPVATQLIAPGLPEFAVRFPELELRVSSTWTLEDLSRGEADVAIRADNNPAESLVGKRLFRYAETVYASPGYLGAYSNRAAGNRGRWIGWGGDAHPRPLWVEKTEFAETEVWGGFSEISLQVAAAEAGLGLIALPCFIGDRSPGLCRAFGEKPRSVRDIWLLTHPDLRRLRRIKVVMEFLEARMRLHRDLIEGRQPR